MFSRNCSKFQIFTKKYSLKSKTGFSVCSKCFYSESHEEGTYAYSFCQLYTIQHVQQIQHFSSDYFLTQVLFSYSLTRTDIFVSDSQKIGTLLASSWFAIFHVPKVLICSFLYHTTERFYFNT